MMLLNRFLLFCLLLIIKPLSISDDPSWSSSTHAGPWQDMRNKKHKKKPISSSAAPDKTAVSAKVTQSTISQYHTLLKQKAIVKRQIAAKGEDDESSKELLGRLVEIDKKLEAQGGLKAYQEASRLGQAEDRGGDSSKILVGWLKEGAFEGRGKTRESHEKIRCVTVCPRSSVGID